MIDELEIKRYSTSLIDRSHTSYLIATITYEYLYIYFNKSPVQKLFLMRIQLVK